MFWSAITIDKELKRARCKISNSKISLHHHQLPAGAQQYGLDKKKFHTILKDWLSRCNQNKRKTIAPHITLLMCCLVLLLTISLQLVESCG